MQAVNIRIGADFRERIRRLKRGGETYEDVLKRILDRAEEAGLDIEPKPEG